MLEYNVEKNKGVFIRLQLQKADTGLFPQAKIFAIDTPSTVVDTINLAELDNGLYGLEWINPGIRKKYFTQTIVYTNSGHTNAHAIIRPDSDSINVGFSAGGFFFSGQKTVTRKHHLTKEEIQKIAKATMLLLKPVLAKKSEFNFKKDIVNTNFKIKETKVPTVKDIVEELILALSFDKRFNKKELTIKEITSAITKVIPLEKSLAHHFDNLRFPSVEEITQQVSLSLDIDKKIGSIQIPSVEEVAQKVAEILSIDEKFKQIKIPQIEDIEKVVVKNIPKEKEITQIETIIYMIEHGTNILAIFKKFKVLNLKDKEELFGTLASNHPRVLLQLNGLAKTEILLSKHR